MSRRRASKDLGTRCLRCAYCHAESPGYCWIHKTWVWQSWATCKEWVPAATMCRGQLSLAAEMDGVTR